MATMPRSFEVEQEEKAAARWEALGRQLQLKDSPGGRGDIRSLVGQLATEYGVDPTFATAIAQVESNFQPHLTSNAGAQGVMQLMPGTGQRFGVRDPFDPEQNIRGGLKYLAALQAMFPGRRDLQMAAYNAGEGAVQQYGKTVPPYPETQQYVQKVQGLLQQAAGPVQLASGTGGIVPDASAVPSARISSGTGGIVPGPPAATPPAAPTVTQPFAPPPRPALDASPLPDMVAAGPQPEAPWTPARKPMEPGLQDPVGPAFLASLGVGAAKSAASLLETPNTAARMLGFRDMGNIGNAAEAIGQFLRESVAKPVAPRGEQPAMLMKIAEGAGAAVPLIIPGIAAERGVMAIVSQAPRIAAAFGAAVSGVLQGAVSMNDTYQSLVPLVGETEAAGRAQKAFWLNTMLGAVGSQLGIFNTRVPEGLARVIAGATSQGVQGAMSYDIGQSLFWVPKDNPNTPALVAQGWEAQGDRVVQPYRFKDQLEAALVQTVVGAAFAGVHELARLPMPEALKPFETDPGFTVEKAVQAAISPDAPPAEVPLPLWQRWAKGVLDLLPEPNLGEGSALGEGLLQRILGSERGSLSPERLRLRKEYGEAQRDINALGEGGDRAEEVIRRMGVDSPDAAYGRARAQEAQATEGLRQLPPEDAALPPALPAPAEGTVPGSEGPMALPGAPPTTQVPAEGETQPPHRDASGRLRRNLEGIHTQELEVQEAIKQHDENGRWGIKLTGERELSDEFLSLIRPTSLGDQPSFTPGIQVRGLLNNKSGLTVQAMAERLHEHGFLQTADKQALLHVLQRSIVDGHKMYSANATGRISALDNPLVAAAEEHAREAIQSLDARTELQRRGTQSHVTLLAESESMVQMGLWEPADLPAMVPGTTLDAASLGAVVLSVSKVGEQLQQQALRVVETGGRPGSAEVGDFFEILAHMAQIDPARVGAIAEPARATGYMNAPMSAYNRFLNELHAVMATHGDQTALTMARQYLAIATPEERLALSAAATAEAERMRTGPWESSATPLMEGPGGPAIRGEGEQQALLTLPEFEALRSRPAGELDAYLGGLFEHNYGPGLPEELSQRVTPQAAMAQGRAREQFLADLYRESGQIAEGELFRQRQAEDPFSAINDPTVEQPSLFGPTAMRPHRDAEMLAKQQEIFFAKLRAESGLPPEGERFQTYRPREGVHHPLDEGTPLMLDARQSVQPGFEERVRVWHEKLTKQAMEETDPMTRQALLGELKVQHDGIWQQYHATVASRTHVQAEIDAAQSRLRVAQAGMMHTRPGFAEMLTEQTTAAMLGPTSWIKNETGNTGMGIWGLGTRFLAEQIGRLHPETGMVPGETAADLYAATHGLVEHFRAASRYWHGGESQFAIGSGGESGKTDVYRKAVTTENVNALFGTQMDPEGIAGKVLDFWAEYVGFLSGGRFTHRVMNTRDEFYKSWNASRESNALAWREAVRQGIAEGSAFADHTALIRSDPNLAAEIRQEALGQALEMTLQDPAKPGGVADKFTQLSNWRIHIPGTEEQELPVGRLLNPFIKIPANGIKRQIENSPLAALGADWRKTMAEGGVKADRQLAKVIMGSGLMASIAMYVGTGNVTGRAPDNPALRDAWLKEHPEYSTRVPFTDVWLPYRWTGPMGDQIAMVVDAAQIMGTIPDNLAKKLAVGIGYSFIKNIWNQGASKNIADFFDAFSPNPGEREDTYGQRLAHWGLRQGISSFGVPMSGGLIGSWGSRAAIRAFDPEKKAAKDLFDQVWAQTPWSTNVPAHRTLNADPMLLGYGVGPETLTALVRAFSPLRPQASLAGPADKAIVANNIKLTYPSRVLDPTAVPEGSAAQVAVDYRTLQPLVLTGRQYERLQSLAALNEDRAKELFPPSEGPIIPLALLRQVTQGVAKATIGRPPPSAAMSVGDMMDWIATQPEFTDDMRSSPGPRGGKAQKLSLAVAEYRKVGTQLFLELDPSQVGERLRQSKIQHALEQLPVPQQGIMRPMLEQSYRQGRHSARSSMGLPPLPVGAQ